MLRTLVLDHRGVPARTTSWKDAIDKVMCGSLALEVVYPNQFARSMLLTVPIPAVVRQTDDRLADLFALEPTRRHVFARDRHRCAYCGKYEDELLDALTIDHVVPRNRARNGKVRVPWMDRLVGVHSWHNLVAACGPCNWKKGDHTPDEVSMPLRYAFPSAPSTFTRARIIIGRYADPPREWRPFLQTLPLDLVLELDPS